MQRAKQKILLNHTWLIKCFLGVGVGCFRGIGAFSEDYEIKTSKLIHLLIAEGFVKLNGDKSLEEEAEDYLKDLATRNLLLICCYKGNGKPKRCGIHDLLRDLCMRKACEDKFLHVKKSHNVTMSYSDEDKFPRFSNLRRVSVHTSCGMEEAKLMSVSLTRSFLSTENEMIPSSFFSGLRLVKVLDVMYVRFREFQTEILQLVNLRFLAAKCDSSIPSGISRLWNLQTLIAITDGSALPFEIWEVPELRHLKLVNELIWFRDECVKQIVHKNVETISLVALSRSLIRNGFFENIPNIKDLEICYIDELQLSLVDLSHLHKLETLRCQSMSIGDSHRFWSTLKFPSALRNLTLHRIAIFPRVSTLMCALPNLEVLKIDSCGFKRKDKELEAPDQAWGAKDEGSLDVMLEAEDEELDALLDENGEEWEVAEGDEFGSLQFLSLGYLRLKRWRANKTNFPRLHHLRLLLCRELEEIPNGIGDIPTLELIELQYCSESVEASARLIQEVQQYEYGNYDLKFVYKKSQSSG